MLATSTSLLSGCLEVSPEVVSTGASRPPEFNSFYVRPLNAAVLMIGSQLGPRIHSTNPDIDTKVEPFDNITASCKTLSNRNRHVTIWPWFENIEYIKQANNFSIYIAEKAYIRFLTAYCVGRFGFYNEASEESQLTSSDLGNIKAITSNKITITGPDVTANYNLLISQSETINGVNHLLYSLAQHDGATTPNRFYERLNYTQDTTTDVTADITNTTNLSYISLLIDSAYKDDNTLPKSYYLRSYSIKRIELNHDPKNIYDFIRIRTARMAIDPTTDKLVQTVINARLISHPIYGTHITEALGCAVLDVTSIGDLTTADCPTSKFTTTSFYVNDAAQIRWLDNSGVDNKYDITSDVKKALFTDYSGDVDNLDIFWFNFSSDTLTGKNSLFQTTKPTEIIYDP